MNSAEELDQMRARISYAVAKHEYLDLEPVMHAIMLRDNRLEVLAVLANRLSSLAFDALLLRNLTAVIQWPEDDFRRLFVLSTGKQIANYNLMWFFLIHGRAKKTALQRLGALESDRIDGFEMRLQHDGPLPNEDKMTRRMYADLGIPTDLVSTFRAKFSE